MTLALDTSILIELERRNPIIIKKMKELSELDYLPPYLPFISYYEFLRGLKIKGSKNYEKKLAFLNKFNTLKTSKKTAEILADLKIKYDKQGITLPLADFLITSQVIENNLTLVTMDRDFEKIESLKKIIL
ncbi:PIN domain-containing protein [Candidatus Pacearchaeota archaeon]|nr:PIN domain-containing protein [Candidatus Pacearchaeota archaeon]